MEIEVGEYIRTHKGDIHKVIGIREELRDGKRVYGYKAYYLDSKKGSLTKAFIIKHSKNIIDLIEVGDYVNGELVSAIYDENEEDEQIQIETNNQGKYIYYINNDIESIVTKEQFKNIEYRLE